MTIPVPEPSSVSSPADTGQTPAHVDRAAWKQAIGGSDGHNPGPTETAPGGRRPSLKPTPSAAREAPTKTTAEHVSLPKPAISSSTVVPVPPGKAGHSERHVPSGKASLSERQAGAETHAGPKDAASKPREVVRPFSSSRMTEHAVPDPSSSTNPKSAAGHDSVQEHPGSKGMGADRSTLDRLTGRITAEPSKESHYDRLHHAGVRPVNRPSWSPFHGTPVPRETLLQGDAGSSGPRHRRTVPIGNPAMRALGRGGRVDVIALKSKDLAAPVAASGIPIGIASVQTGSSAPGGPTVTSGVTSSSTGSVSASLTASSPASLASAVTGMIASQTQSARITLHPESLGQVSVVLQAAASGKVDVHLVASSQAGHDLLSATKSILAQHLAGSGLSVGLIAVQPPGAAQPSSAFGGNASLSNGQGTAVPFGQGGAGGQGGFSGNGSGGHPATGSPRPDPGVMPPDDPETDDTVTAYA